MPEQKLMDDYLHGQSKAVGVSKLNFSCFFPNLIGRINYHKDLIIRTLTVKN